MKMKIAIIGTGNLGLSIAKGLIINDIITKLYLTKRNYEDIQKWNENRNITVTNDNREAVSNSDILIFAVQPSQLENVLTEVVDLLNEKHVIISTITGFKINLYIKYKKKVELYIHKYSSPPSLTVLFFYSA